MTNISSQRLYNPENFVSSGASLFPQHRITITEIDGHWREAVVERLDELVRLKRGWDGYVGVPVSFENATFALSLLEATCRANTTPPQIVPGSNGDLQLEWHTEKGDVELLVRGPYNVRAWSCFVDTGNAEGEEVELTSNFLLVANWIAAVME